MIRWIFSVIAVVCLISSSEANEAIFAKAKAAITNKLRDPSSAQFRNMRMAGDFACGEVNARNRMGGYEGFKGFVYHEKSNVAVIGFGSEISTDPLDGAPGGYDKLCK